MRTTRIILSIFIIAVLLGLSALPKVSHAAPLHAPVNPGTTNLVSWWSLNETSGTRNDSHGSNHLTDNNTVDYVSGVKNNAANLTFSNNESLTRSSNSSLQTGDIGFTYGAWVNMKTIADYNLIRKWSGSGQQEYLLGFYQSVSNKFIFWVSSNGTDYTNVVYATSASASTWYFVVVWHDPTANTINIQVNNGTVSSTTWSSGVYASGTQPFTIGVSNNYVDEVFFYKRVLIADERAWLYNSGTGREYCELTSCATATPTSTYTATNTATSATTNTATNTATATFTPSNTPTSTNTPTATDANTPTATDTPTETITPTETLTPTITSTPTITFTPSPTRTPGNIATAFWDGMITYGDAANVTVTSLLCLVVVIGLLAWLATTYLQQRRNRK